jgi:GT2 family glycosyltransferase
VDVVVPFRGGLADLEDLRERLARMRVGPGDSVLVVDNTPRRERLSGPQDGTVPVLYASERATPGFARNRGASLGSGEWLVFFDADTEPSEDLLDRYFDPPPGARTALIGGGVIDEAVPEDAPIAARYAYLRRAMSQDDTFRFGRWGYAKTANAACRRVAFEAVGGFRDDIRAGEDADLTYRLKAGGWEVERRERAAVVHRSRRSVREFMIQRALHGAGGAWLNRTYPGSFPPRRRPGLVWWAVRASTTGLLSAARRRDRDQAICALCDPLELLVWEFGRSIPNQRPLPGHSRRRRVTEP